MDFTEKTIATTDIYNGRIVHLKEDTVSMPDGSIAKRELVIHGGGVGVLALDENNEVYMVRQWRKPYDEVVLEIPAGKLESGEDIKAAALRELMEETGYLAKTIMPMGKYYPTPGYCSEIIYLYLAKDLEYVGQNLDPGEFIEVIKIPLATLLEMVMDNKIYDAKTAIAILKADKLINA